jgi:thioesterase domain-containing protein/acyl carrier protein
LDLKRTEQRVSNARVTGSDDAARRKGSEEIESSLIALWEESLRTSPIHRDDDFHALGANSLDAANLLIRVEERFGRRLPFSSFFGGASTVAGMAQVLSAMGDEQNVRAEPTLVAVQPNGRRTPVCWLPGGSGMSSIPYRELSLLLGPDQPVYALESPLLLEGPFDLRSRARSYLAVLRAALPPPYVLFGYSSGAWMALEMARNLHAAGVAVKHLVVFDAPVPRTLTRRERVIKLGQHARWHLRRARTEPLRELARVARGVRQRLQRLLGPVEEEGGFAPGSVYDVVDRATRASLLAYSQEAHPPWPGRITLVLGERVDWPGIGGLLDLRLGWREIAGGGFEVIRVPSDHLSMLEGAEGRHLAAQLLAVLARDG